jgi:hypothetical protein
MKTKILFMVLAFITLFFSRILSQEKPIIVSPLIGDVLDKTERERRKLFPDIKGFEQAEFFLNPDSTLKVKIFTRINGIWKDSIIEKYKKLTDFRKDLERSNPVIIYMKNGSIIKGSIYEKTKDSICIKTDDLGVLYLSNDQVKRIGGNENWEIDEGVVTFNDPNTTRAFIMPTGNMLPAKGGYIADYELIFFSAAYGITDWLMINGGLLLLPISPENQLLNFGIKTLIAKPTENISIAAGIQVLKIPDAENLPSLGYGVISFGDADKKFSIGAGAGFDLKKSRDAYFGMAVSGETRTSKSTKIMAEFWYLKDAGFSPLILGIRFFGSRLSGDIGLLYPIGAELSSPIGFPVVNLVYNF